MGFDGVSGSLTVAAVQATPAFLDRAATVEVAARHVASAGAELSRIAAGRLMFDPTGHYARPDVLSLRQSVRGVP